MARRLLMLLLLSFVAALLSCVAEPPAADADWLAALEQHRADREERLRDPDGWFTLVGLFWLEPGANAFGTDPNNPIVLKADGIAPVAGELHLEDGAVTVRAAASAGLRIDDAPVTEQAVLPDAAEDGPQVMELGRLRFHVVQRGDRFGVRVKDPEHPALAAFDGLDYFDADPGYRLDAAFLPYDEPREVEVMSVVGTSSKLLVPGEVEFTLAGRELKLLPLVSDPETEKLWFIFKDQTSGKESYGFRYLYGDLAGGRVDLDFNRAYNPPCAFTPHATCPLPPRENRLEVPIEAGERIYGKH